MSDTAANLHRKIASAAELESVVRTMKAMAAANITQYENAVRALDDYYRTVQLGLAACFQHTEPWNTAAPVASSKTGGIIAIAFGSDQGLVGPFNETLAEFVVTTVGNRPGRKTLWTVGERMGSRLADTNLDKGASFNLPNAIGAITPLVGQILLEIETRHEAGDFREIHLFHNHPQPGGNYTPVSQRLLPLDTEWQRQLTPTAWPAGSLPEVLAGAARTLPALVREYLFVTLFRACAESLASENASRLAAMQRAEKNIDELQEDLKRTYHRLRQSSIDEELFDVVAGFEALSELK
ncbi:MAG: F0F1 ATP synthase subunit gamma [Halothiobacillus sp.]